MSSIEAEGKCWWGQSNMKPEIFISMNTVIAEIILEIMYLNPNSYDVWCQGHNPKGCADPDSYHFVIGQPSFVSRPIIYIKTRIDV